MDSPRWSNRYFLLTVVVLFLAHLGLVFYYSATRMPAPKPTRFQSSFQFFTQNSQTQIWSQWLAFQDPTLFSQPLPWNFSGKAWLNPRPMPYQTNNWVAPDHMLSNVPQHLGEGIQRLLIQESRPSPPVAENPIPILIPPLVPPLNVNTQSVVRFRPPFSSFKLLPPGPLPSWVSSNMLTSTVIEIGIDEQGWVRSSVLLTGCGLITADQYALNWVKKLPVRQSSQDHRKSSARTDSILGKHVFRLGNPMDQ